MYNKENLKDILFKIGILVATGVTTILTVKQNERYLDKKIAEIETKKESEE